MSDNTPRGLGWIPDLPDNRDLTLTSTVIRAMLTRLAAPTGKSVSEVDLRQDEEGVYFSAVRDQLELNASSAFACLAVVEYFERRILGNAFDGSPLFLYQATRYRIQKSMPLFDVGADLRTTLKVLTQVGVPSEKCWPYEVAQFSREPSSYIWSAIKPLSHISYFRLFDARLDWKNAWHLIRAFLSAGFPLIFGYSVPSQQTDADIHFRFDLDAPLGGQCAVALGYQANRYGPEQHAILIRSSWGREWGDAGNGWLPVSSLRYRMAGDFWCLMSELWLNSEELQRPHLLEAPCALA